MGRHRQPASRRRIAVIVAGSVAAGVIAGWAAPSLAGSPCKASDLVCHFTYTNSLISANGKKIDQLQKTVDKLTAPTGSPSPSPTATPTHSTSPTPTPSKTASPTPTPTATATPTPTPTSSPTTQPPETVGFPDASNTGYKPTGVTPKIDATNCPATITRAGTYDACIFPAGVTIKTTGVVITRSLIDGQVSAGDRDDGTPNDLIISDTEIACGCESTPSTTPPAVSFSSFTLLRDNIHNAGHGVQINHNAIVEDSYVHDLGANNGAHKDAVISNGGGNAVIRHNNLECAADSCSAAIGLFGDFAPISHWTIDHNLLNTTGGYCLYGGDGNTGPNGKKYPTASNITVTNNQFGRKDWPKCGQYGPDAYYGTRPGSTWSGNQWADTGVLIAPQ